MGSLKAITIAGTVAVTLLASMASFNYAVDPICFYHCEKIDISKHTRNHYYTVAQKILAHPETEMIVLGSSRGESTSPVWLQKKTGLKTLNLSIGGAEMLAKTAFLDIALENTKLKKVIWYADYFELITSIADVRIKDNPALKHYLPGNFGKTSLSSKTKEYVELINHNTLEASYYALKDSSKQKLDQGSGTYENYDLCEKPFYQGARTVQKQEKEIGLSYDSYTRKIFPNKISEDAWGLFIDDLHKLSQRHVDVLVVIPPYNPVFEKRLAHDFPDVLQKHKEWIERLKMLNHGATVRVVNYFDGIPGDDQSPRYWDDGVHFSCKGVIKMLGGVI